MAIGIWSQLLNAFHSLYDGCQDIGVVATAADVLAQGGDELFSRCTGIITGNCHRTHDMPRHAVTALKGLIVKECLLDPMEFAILHKAFDGLNGFRGNIAYRCNA
jgi:hypothetical protein